MHDTIATDDIQIKVDNENECVNDGVSSCRVLGSRLYQSGKRENFRNPTNMTYSTFLSLI